MKINDNLFKNLSFINVRTYDLDKRCKNSPEIWV